MQRIPYTKPSISQLEIDYADDAVRNGWGAKCYEYIHRFERQFCAYLGTTHAIATSSCTGAMHMGLSALGIGDGDEIILADTNWIATVSPIIHLGAKPVFVDIDPLTWCIDPQKIESAITKRTRAIVATHLYGQLCDMDPILEIARRFQLEVIEDAAEAIGSSYKGRKAGSMGRFGVFSFHGTKTLTTGEGGMLVTNDDGLYEDVLTLSNHGRSRNQTKQFWPDRVGFKYKISNVQAAIGCAQLERIDSLVQRKRQILDEYRDFVSSGSNCHMNADQKNCVIGAWMPNIVFDRDSGVSRDSLIAAFEKADIDARVFFHPLSKLDFFDPAPKNVNAWSICERAINLPSYHDITGEEIDRVCDVLSGFIAQ